MNSFFVRKFENEKGKDGIYTDPSAITCSMCCRSRGALAHLNMTSSAK